MSVRSVLGSAGIKLCSEVSHINCAVSGPDSMSAAPPFAPEARQLPLVSCLMMTRGNIERMRHSLICYRRQTYANRELVVVTEPNTGDQVRAFIASQELLNAIVLVAPPGLTIGDHRNLGAARANGQIMIVWDDDDLSDPLRIEAAVSVLRNSAAAAGFLSRLLLWWPQRRVAAISGLRPWEQTMAVWRGHMPIYAGTPRGGDTVAVNWLRSTHRIALIDCPLLYIYAVTGNNIWGAAHFEKILRGASCVFEGDQFAELNRVLSERLPVLEYAAMLTG
jgi:hypothetical protein